jgi:RNA-splicing ligase RtcB
MLEFIGKYTSCQVMIDEIETEAVSQIYNFLNCPAFEGAKIRIQPDVHAGAGAVIGFTSTLTDKIIPNVIGVDIGCGVLSVGLGAQTIIDFSAFDRYLREHVPSGFSVNDRVHPKIEEHRDAVEYRRVAKETEQPDVERVMKALKSLGGGNHFIEIGRDQNEHVWLTIHSGSRNFGLKICNWHQKRAVKTVGAGRGLEWLEGEKAQHYLDHMDVAQRYAAHNRRLMAEQLLRFFSKKLDECEVVESVHNYINFQDRILRKGAISTHAGERVIIPWNMRDGLIIARGKGNPEWNYSAPHGAGRVMGRGAAKRALKVEDFQESMTGIWSSCIGASTLDESPAAYKDHQMIQDAIGDTVEIELIVKPLYNFKASD